MGNIPYLIGGLVGAIIGIGFWIFVMWLLWKLIKQLFNKWREKAGFSWRIQMKYAVAAVVACLLIIAGGLAYRRETRASAPPQVAAPQPPPAYQRFLPYPQATGLALDTKTGLLCHTFSEDADIYVPTGRSHTSGIIVGSEIEMGHWSLNSAPLCYDLSQDETNTLTRVGFTNSLALENKTNNEK